MNTRPLSVTLFATASFILGGCTAMRGLMGGDGEQAIDTPAPPSTEPAPPAVPPCDYTERDLTRPWALRRYWCDGQAVSVLPAQTTAPMAVPVAQDSPLSPIWFARGYRDLGPDGLRRTASLARQLKQMLRAGQTIWLRGSALASETDAGQLAFDRAWAVRVALLAQGVDAPIRIRRPNGARYGRKVLVSVI